MGPQEVEKDNILNKKEIVANEINCQDLEAKFNLSTQAKKNILIENLRMSY